MRYSAALTIYHGIKVWLYKKYFSQINVRIKYKLVKGKTLTNYKAKLMPFMYYPQSVCNAGILSNDEGVISVVKNQTFSLCEDAGSVKQNKTLDHSWKDLKRLYRIEFDSDWSVKNVDKIQATVNNLLVEDEEGLEDARLFRHRGDVWLCATLLGHTKQSWPYIGKLQGNVVALTCPKYGVSPPQKNWMPFEIDGYLYFEYSVNPHIVLSCDPESAECTLVANTSYRNTNTNIQIHGGAPALRYDSEHFLGVANTQERFWYQERYYATQFYLFEATPPFKVTHTSKPIRIGSHKNRVRYVAGMFFVNNKRSIIISMGIDDCENCIVELKLKDIWKKLEHVSD